MNKIAFISHPDCSKHDMESDHPESPLRINSIVNHIIEADLAPFLHYMHAPLAELEQIELAHTEEHIAFIFDNTPKTGFFTIDPDTRMGIYTLNAILHASGAVVKATDIVMSGEYRHAYCNVRPPGHHAEKNQPMGFCFFNNIAIGALYALEHYNLSRVAIVDFDVHHGNGTEDIVAHHDNILYCSTFQSPLYPDKAAKSQQGKLVNVPLKAQTGSTEFRQAIRDDWLPELEAFQPELIFISAGFDAHRDEFIAGLNLVEDDFEWVTKKLCQLADKTAQGRIVSALEGGYELSALGRSAVAHIKALMLY